jgi:hypothetical protein
MIPGFQVRHPALLPAAAVAVFVCSAAIGRQAGHPDLFPNSQKLAGTCLSTNSKIMEILGFLTGRSTLPVVARAGSARTASRRAPGIASRYVRQNLTLIFCLVLSKRMSVLTVHPTFQMRVAKCMRSPTIRKTAARTVHTQGEWQADGPTSGAAHAIMRVLHATVDERHTMARRTKANEQQNEAPPTQQA